MKITHTRYGEIAGGITFRGPELRIVAGAASVASTRTDSRIVRVATLPLENGVVVEIAAGASSMLFRTALPDGRKGRSTCIAGDELDAVRRALADLGVRGPAIVRREMGP